MVSPLHAERLDTVAGHILASGARSVLDLGCGPGELLTRLAPMPQVERLVGIDLDAGELARARAALLAYPDRVELLQASFADPSLPLGGFDLAALVETIEHIDPQRLGEVERAVFAGYRPRQVLVTTPNQEFNVLHGMRPGTMRHPDHRFEWSRERFRRWARGVGQRHGYRVAFFDIGEVDEALGASTQMARFTRDEDGG